MEDTMDAVMWGGLPFEIEERVLSYLSVPVLCRFRTVCKRWNALICNPEFAALCIRTAAQDASFLVSRSYTNKGDHKSGPPGDDWPWFVHGQSRGWVFLDVKARRWYTIAKSSSTDEKLFDKWGRCMAMDGGLVCQVLPGVENAAVFVSNPIAQTESTLLPTPKHPFKTFYAAVGMVVDASAGCYTVFVLPNCRKLASEENPFMVIYDSRTDAWRTSSLPVVTEVCVNVERSVVCFNGLLYVLACADRGDAQSRGYMRPGHSWLWSYSFVEDDWQDTGVVINLETLWKLTFLVSDSRLFLASWVREWKGRINWTYQVSEIDLDERTLRTVLRVNEAAMMELFEVAFRNVPDDMLLHAFGLGKGIVLLCMKTGITRVYDFRTCTWDDAVHENRPPFPNSMSAFGPLVCFGKPMNLVMPAASESWKKDVSEAESLEDDDHP